MVIASCLPRPEMSCCASSGPQCTEFYCDVTKGPRVPIQVRGHLRGPTVTINTPAIDFGFLQLSRRVTSHIFSQIAQFMSQRACSREQASVEVVLANPTGVVAEWALTSGSMSEDEVAFQPDCGQLLPGKERRVTVFFVPKAEKSVRGMIALKVRHSEPLYISVHAEVSKSRALALSLL